MGAPGWDDENIREKMRMLDSIFGKLLAATGDEFSVSPLS